MEGEEIRPACPHEVSRFSTCYGYCRWTPEQIAEFRLSEKESCDSKLQTQKS